MEYLMQEIKVWEIRVHAKGRDNEQCSGYELHGADKDYAGLRREHVLQV
jgi:hypothetical protein